MGVCCGKGGAEEVEEMVDGGEGEVDFRGRHCGWCFVLVGRGGVCGAEVFERYLWSASVAGVYGNIT